MQDAKYKSKKTDTCMSPSTTFRLHYLQHYGSNLKIQQEMGRCRNRYPIPDKNRFATDVLKTQNTAEIDIEKCDVCDSNTNSVCSAFCSTVSFY